MYGKELALDIHNADNTVNSGITSAEYIEEFMIDLCKRIDMKRMDFHSWVVDDPVNNLYGTTACQFIDKSSITMHTHDRFRKLYVNVFSCKDFDSDMVEAVILDYFGGEVVGKHELKRI